MFSKLLTTGIALSLGCAVATATTAPAVAQPLRRVVPTAAFANNVRFNNTHRYIYVSDTNNQKVYVYPSDLANPAPVNAIPFVGNPTSVAVAPNGNVYVVVGNTALGQDNIFIYTPGGKKLVGSIGASNGITSIRDIAFDSHGNLFTSAIQISNGSVGIMEYAANTTESVRWFPSPTTQTYGIMLDAKDNLFVDLGLYGMAIEFATVGSPQPYVTVGVFGAPTAGGLAFSGTDLIMTGGTGLWVFTPSPPGSKYAYTRTAFINYGVGHGTGYLTRDSNGTLYVPVYGSSGGHSTVHEIRIYNQADVNHPQFASYATISNSLQFPSAVAIGPQ